VRASQRAFPPGWGVGDIVTITPSVFSTTLERARSTIDLVIRDIAIQPHRLTAEQRAAWTSFVMRWGAFYNEHVGSPVLSSAFHTTYDQILDFEREAISWREALQRSGGSVTTPAPAGPETRPAGLTAGTPFLWGALIITGVFAIGYVVKAFKSGVRS
jgi:hypothetical protein